MGEPRKGNYKDGTVYGQNKHTHTLKDTQTVHIGHLNKNLLNVIYYTMESP